MQKFLRTARKNVEEIKELTETRHDEGKLAGKFKKMIGKISRQKSLKEKEKLSFSKQTI